jgi:hypothetical protein
MTWLRTWYPLSLKREPWFKIGMIPEARKARLKPKERSALEALPVLR